MKSIMQRIGLYTIKASNVFFMMIPIVYIWEKYYAKMAMVDLKQNGCFVISIIFLLVYTICGHIYEGFLISTVKISEIVFNQSLSVLLTDMVIYLISVLVIQELPMAIPMVIAFCIQIVISIFWSYISQNLYFYMFPSKRTAVICDCQQDVEGLIELYGMQKKFNVLAIKDINDCMKNGIEFLEDMQVVFLCGVHSHIRNMILKYCVTKKIRVYVIPRIGDVIMSGASQIHLFHLPLLRVEGYNPSLQYLFFKRLIDIFVSGMAIIIFLPVMIFTAIAIKLDDGGPVFYKQCRLTKDGEKFNIIKFRSMCQEAEKDGIARLSTGNEDSRITAVGRVIRKVRIDELPQLFNILAGSMSLVGPRPERPEIAKQYEKKLPEFSLRLQAKAGLTGYAQVYGKYNTEPYDKLLMDLTYIANPSILEDFKIMLVTLKVLFTKESTEGVMPGKVTAIECGRDTEEKRDEIQRCDTSLQ